MIWLVLPFCSRGDMEIATLQFPLLTVEQILEEANKVHWRVVYVLRPVMIVGTNQSIALLVAHRLDVALFQLHFFFQFCVEIHGTQMPILGALGRQLLIEC